MLISSHLLAELEQLIDDVVIIADGRIRLATPLADLDGGRLGSASGAATRSGCGRRSSAPAAR